MLASKLKSVGILIEIWYYHEYFSDPFDIYFMYVQESKFCKYWISAYIIHHTHCNGT